MSISSPIQPPPAQAPSPKPLTQAESARIILESAPPVIKDDVSRQTLKGEVTAVKPDGTVQIKTDQGSVEIKIPPESRGPKPQAGDRVEIDIPPASADETAPREVRIRITERPAPPAQEAQASPPRTSETPVDVRLEPPPPLPPPVANEEEPQPAQPPLAAGDIVRLQPLPPELLASVSLPQPEALPPAQLDALSTKILQALPNRVVSLNDIPLRPVLTSQSEIRTDLLQAPLAAPATLKPGIAPPPASVATPAPIPAPSALLPGLPLVEPAATPETPLVKSLTLLAFPSGANTPPALTAQTTALQIQPLAGLITPEVFTTSPAALALPVSPSAEPITLHTVAVTSPPAEAAPATLSLQISSITPPEPFLTAKTEGGDIPAARPTFTPSTSEANIIIKQNTRPDILIAKVSGALKGDIPLVKLETGATAEAAAGTPEPLFILRTPEPGITLPTGTELSLSQPASLGAAGATPLPAALGSIQTALLPPYPLTALTPEGWPILDQIYQNLIPATPQAAASMMNMMPNPATPGQIMPAALFFIAAMRTGDLQGWLGDKALESLKVAGKSGLLSRLTQEGGILSRLSNEPLSGEWRGMAFPMSWQNDIHKIALYYKREERSAEESDTGKGAKGTRFIMDLTLTQIGRTQLDGYIRDKSFDLILRTPEPFSGAARHTLRALYHNALEVEGLTGDLVFQNKPDQWIKITGGLETYRTLV